MLEKTERCGKKLALAGGKKGNFTHACGPREMAERFDCDPRVLVPLLKRFPYQRVAGFFRSLGIELSITNLDEFVEHVPRVHASGIA